MKNLNTIIQASLAIAIVVLFFLYNQRPTIQSEQKPTTPVASIDSTSTLKLAFINTDSLFQNLDMAADLQVELEKEKKRYTQLFERKRKRFEEAYLSLQKEAQNALTREDLQQLEIKAQQKQGELLRLEQQYQEEYLALEQNRTQQVRSHVLSFIETFNQEKGYDYILGKTLLGNVLYGHPRYDLTHEVTDALNQQYQQEKTGSTTAPSSTTAP